MKTVLHELDRAFAFELTAETVADAAALTRLALNATTHVERTTACAARGGGVSGWVSIGKRVNGTSEVSSETRRKA